MSEVENFENFIRKWTTDADGNRVMRGLTPEETAWYQEYQAKMLEYRKDRHSFPWNSVSDMREERNRWLSLHDRHEIARIATISAEVELRVDKPRLN